MYVKQAEQQIHQVWGWQVILDPPVIRVVQSRRSQEGSQHLGSGGKLQEVSHFKLLQFQQPAKSCAKVWKYPAWAHPVLMFGFPKPLEIWKFKSPGKLSKMENNDQSVAEKCSNVANTIISVILYLDIRVSGIAEATLGNNCLLAWSNFIEQVSTLIFFLDFQLNKHDTDCTTVAGAIKLNCKCTTISKWFLEETHVHIFFLSLNS